MAIDLLSPSVHALDIRRRLEASERRCELLLQRQKSLEAQLLKAQKMEALGHLAGGIAHDFNNLLAIIVGNNDFLLEALPADDPRHADAEAILEAADRASALTKQILAFSRQQPRDAGALPLNDAVRSLERMLRRVIGEDIDLSIALDDNAGLVESDPSHLEQVILNLVVNARDAMPHGGRLSIATSSVAVDRPSGDNLPPPGRYVMLSITDTGCGMDEDTKRRIFDPFFTTKGPTKGTGLGLAVCNSIVSKAGGRIEVTSEVDRGTTFRVYFPMVEKLSARTEAQATEFDAHQSAASKPAHTILLVEDDEGVRALVRRGLEHVGYRVLDVADGAEAMAVARSHKGQIDLVLSDVVMPDLSGAEVVNRVRQIAGVHRSLFMSGYSSQALVELGALREDAAFIQKPFTTAVLASKVRDVLGADVWSAAS